MEKREPPNEKRATDMTKLFMIATALLPAVFLSAAESPGAARDVELAPAACNAALWDHVYNPSRLQVVSQCITASGIVEESVVDDDGDQHFLLKLDPGQDHLLKKRNLKKKKGDLVAEIICANRAHLKKARDACASYTNEIALPAVGAHVKVTGTHVIDSHNGWTEIHPVSSIETIR